MDPSEYVVKGRYLQLPDEFIPTKTHGYTQFFAAIPYHQPYHTYAAFTCIARK